MRLFVTSLLSSCLILSVSGFHHLMPISGMASYYGGGPSARMTPSHPLASLFGLGHHYPPARSQIMPGYDLYNRMMSGGQHDVTTPSATADPLSSMLRSELSSVRARADQILHQTRAQSAVMAEQYLANLDQDEQCFHRSYCEASIKEAAEGTARAAKEAIKVMEAILANSPASTELPSVQQLVAAYNVGSMTKNAQLCRWLFPCSSAAKAVNSEASEVTSRRMSEEDDEAEARFVTCKHISRLCPGVSLSCGLCAVFGPDSCSIVCPVGAIYCGTSGYACALESAKKNKKEEDKKPEAEEEAVEENATDDEVTTEEVEARTTERSANEEVRRLQVLLRRCEEYASNPEILNSTVELDEVNQSGGLNDLERLVLTAAGGRRVLDQTDDLRWLAHKHAEDQTKFIKSGEMYDYATCGPHSWMVSPPPGVDKCCYPKNYNCMVEAQNQHYKYKGWPTQGRVYEITCTGNGEMTAQTAMDCWKTSPPHMDVILGNKYWKSLSKFGCSYSGNAANCYFQRKLSKKMNDEKMEQLDEDLLEDLSDLKHLVYNANHHERKIVPES